MNAPPYFKRKALYRSQRRQICNIVAHLAIEKPPEITYTKFSNPSEPGCLRQKWNFDRFANFPSGRILPRRLRNCHRAAVRSRLGGIGCAGTREARRMGFD